MVAAGSTRARAGGVWRWVYVCGAVAACAACAARDSPPRTAPRGLGRAARGGDTSERAGRMASRRRAGPADGGAARPGFASRADDSASALLEQYQKTQLLYIPAAFESEESVAKVVRVLAECVGSHEDLAAARGATGLASPAPAVCASIQKTWNVENGTGGLLRSPQRLLAQLVSALAARASAGEAALSSAVAAAEDGVIGGGKWYTSCVVQHDDAALNQLLLSLPCGGVPPFMLDDDREAGAKRARVAGGRGGTRKQTAASSGRPCAMANAPCAWIFIGQNVGTKGEEVEAMRGRPEHTDAIAHSGTWHMQLSGTKEWQLRPNGGAAWPKAASLDAAQKLVAQHGAAAHADSAGSIRRLHVTCRAGDLLLINTRLWFHATQIPSTCLPARGQVAGAAKRHALSLPISMSVARDFYLGEAAARGAGGHEAGGSMADMVGMPDMPACRHSTRKAPAGHGAHEDDSTQARAALGAGEDEAGQGGVDMTNVDASWALAHIEAGTEVAREHALLAVQDVMNRRQFLCCDACCRPVGGLNEALRLAANIQTRTEVVAHLQARQARDATRQTKAQASEQAYQCPTDAAAAGGRSRKRRAPQVTPASRASPIPHVDTPCLPSLAPPRPDAAEAEEGDGDCDVCAGDGVVLCRDCADTSHGQSCRLLRAMPSALHEEPRTALAIARQSRLLHSLSSGHYATLEMVAHFFARILLEAAEAAGGAGASLPSAPRVLDRTKAEDALVEACACIQADDSACQKAAWWDLVAEADLVEEDARLEDAAAQGDQLDDAATQADHLVEVQLHRVHHGGDAEQDATEKVSGGAGKRHASGHRRDKSAAQASRTSVASATSGGGGDQRRESALVLLPYGLKLAAAGKPLVVEVTPGGSAEAVGVSVGDVLVQVGGVDVCSVSQVCGAVLLWEKEAQETSDEAFGGTVPPTWLALDVALHRAPNPAPAGQEGGSARHTRGERAIAAVADLELLARQAWRLLLQLFDAHAFVVRHGHAVAHDSGSRSRPTPHGAAGARHGGAGVWELVTFERYARVLACIHQASCQVGGGSSLALPAPLALYAHQCLSSSASVAAAGARAFLLLPGLAQDGDELVAEEAMTAKEASSPAASRQRARKPRTAARGAAQADTRKEAVAARRILEAARSCVPSFAGSALFPSVSRLSVVEKDADSNCRLVFDGARLEVVVVATREIKSGELLSLPASCFDQADTDDGSQDESDGSDGSEADDDGS